MKRLQSLPTSIIALGILAACNGTQSGLCPETPTEPVTLDADENGICHVHYVQLDRKAPCTEIVALMRSQLHVPDQEEVALRVAKRVRYDEVAGLLQTLKEAGYRIRKLGYVNVSQ